MPTVFDLLPLEPGRRWHYRLRLGGRVVTHITQEVLMAAARRGGTLARLRRQMEGDPPEVVPAASGQEEARIAGQPVLRAPLEAGATWPGMGPTGPSRYQVTAVDDTVQVPAGRFSEVTVVRVTDEHDQPVAESWYAPGVGLVRYRFVGPTGWGELELESWEKGQMAVNPNSDPDPGAGG